MKGNLMTKIINCLSSEKCGGAGHQVLCGVGAATALGIACVLILSVVGIDFKSLEPVERSGSYKVETGGFVTEIHVESSSNPKLADQTENKRLLLASAGVPEISPLQEIEIEKTDEEKKQININVEPVEEGDTYENLKSALLGDAEEGLMPIEVMRLVASDAEGNAIDLSGWKITMEVTPTEKLREAAKRKLGALMKVLPLGGEVMEKSFTNVEVASEGALSVKIEYTVPENGIAMYALCAEAVYTRALEGDEDWSDVKWVDVSNGEEITVDLNGHTITRKQNPATALKNPLFFVYETGTLTIKDSSGEKSGGIRTEGLNSLINIKSGGVLNISAGKLENKGERVILAEGTGTVNMSGGILTGATGSSWGGGGIYAASGTVTISGGTIMGNTAGQGGGIYAASGTVIISGGTITENKATSDWSGGGGVWARRIEMSDGLISNNEALVAGGGVYAISMLMTGGKISENKAGQLDQHGGGGGGIYITPVLAEGSLSEKDIVFSFYDDAEEEIIKCNMSITGGIIEKNISNHTGGGIFVNRGAVVYIRGENGHVVQIEKNIANDSIEFEHGYGGGGIFVEHQDMYNENLDAKDGGRLYIYNAVITENIARNGGGVAGCGVSNVTVCSVNGVAVYGNTATGNSDVRYKPSDDLYVDGEGTVDSMMMGGVQVTWVGSKKKTPGPNPKYEDIIPITPISVGTQKFEYGFYLHVDNELTKVQKDEINKYATVFIQGNESKTGGGGIGGNGFMKLGLKSPDPEDPKGDLKLTKVVNDAKSNSESQKFDFTIHLTDAQNQVLTGSVAYVKGSGSADPDESESMNLKDGSCNFELGDQEYIKIIDLPVGTHYTITETRVEGYMPGIQLTNADGIIEGETVSGWIGTDGSVVYTNTALYELPETGGETAAMYYLLGCALLVTAMAGGWTYKRRSH